MWNTWSCKYKNLSGSALDFWFFSPKATKITSSHLLHFSSYICFCSETPCTGAASPFIISYLHTSYCRAWSEAFLLCISPAQCAVVLCREGVNSAYSFLSRICLCIKQCAGGGPHGSVSNILRSVFLFFFFFFFLSAGNKCVCEAVAHCYVGLEIALTTKTVPNYCF